MSKTQAPDPAQANEDDIRKAFESEMRCEDEWGHKNLKRDKRGDYLNSWTGSMWLVWKACAATYAEQVARAERNRDMWREQCRRQAAQLEAMHAIPAPEGAPPMPDNVLAGAVCTVAEARGYVAFGAGVYRVQETREPGLVVTFRRDGEQGYAVGDRAPEVDLTPIPSEDIIVRLQFTSAAGLDSLESHLRSIRAEHWPETIQPHAVKHCVTHDEAGAVTKVEAIMSDASTVTVVEVAPAQCAAEGDEPACWIDGGDLEQLAKLGMGGVLGWPDNGNDPRRVPLYTRPATEPHDSRGPTTLEGWRSAALDGEKERDWLRERLRLITRHQEKDCWYWQNDGEDHLESMTNALPVVIRADHLRALLASVQPKGTAKCNCTAYCGQYLMHGSCPAYPAAVTVVPAPAPLTSVCHMECGSCIDAGKCAFPGKPAEPARYPHPDEDDAVTLWAEIHRLRAAVQGPDGYATWQEAATAERVRRVAAEKALAATQAPAPAQGSWVSAEDVQRLARSLDVAINGEAGAAPAPQLCDVVAQAIGIMEARRAEFPVVARWTGAAKNAGPRARVWVQFDDGGPEVEFSPADLQAPAVVDGAPIDMVLHCPACGEQHIDAPEEPLMTAFDPNGVLTWTNPPHRSHLCHECGHVWRPADVPTNGVAAVKTKGKADSPIAQPPVQGSGQ